MPGAEVVRADGRFESWPSIMIDEVLWDGGGTYCVLVDTMRSDQASKARKDS